MLNDAQRTHDPGSEPKPVTPDPTVHYGKKQVSARTPSDEYDPTIL